MQEVTRRPIRLTVTLLVIKNTRKNTDIIQIKFQKILSDRFDEGECRIKNCLNICILPMVKGNSAKIRFGAEIAIDSI